MPFTVIVADNSHYQDKSAEYELGSFETLESAIDASKRIVDDYLKLAHRSGIVAKELYESYLAFGEDPYIAAADVEGVPFSAWEYAKQRCEALCTADSSAK